MVFIESNIIYKNPALCLLQYIKEREITMFGDILPEIKIKRRQKNEQ